MESKFNLSLENYFAVITILFTIGCLCSGMNVALKPNFPVDRAFENILSVVFMYTMMISLLWGIYHTIKRFKDDED